MFTQRVRIIVNIGLIAAIMALSLPAGSAQAAATSWNNPKRTIPTATGMPFQRIATSNAQKTVKNGEPEMGPSVLDKHTMQRALSQKEQAELKEIFGIAPVKAITVSMCGGAMTTYYDSDGNKVGSFHKGAGYRYESLGTYYDKNGNIIRREGTALSAEEQAKLTKIFGVRPTICVQGPKEGKDPDISYDITYFDENGNYIGRKSVSGDTETYLDKDARKIKTNTDPDIQPPVQPDKNEKDIKVWINYVKDLIAYIFKKFDPLKSRTGVLKQGNV